MHVLEKSLQAAVVGGVFGRAAKMAGNVAQIYRAPIYQTHNDYNKCLNPALVQAKMTG